MYIIYLFLALSGMWFVFSGHTSAFFLILGALSSMLALWLGHKMTVICKIRNRPLYIDHRSILYVFWLLKEIVVSGVAVTRIIWSNKVEVDSVIATVDSRQTTDIGRASYANSITLTPGTLCVDVEQGKVTVHALKKSGVAELEEGVMDKRVVKMVGDKA